MSSARPDLFKFVLVGNTKGGKTTLVQRFIAGEFVSGYRQTIGVEFASKNICVKDREIKLQVWDTAGEERYKPFSRSYYRDAQAIFLVYDVTDKASFIALDSWITEIKQRDQNFILVLVGTKSHLTKDKVVTPEEAAEKAKQLKIDPKLCFEVSAETGENVEKMFTAVAKRVYALQPAEKTAELEESPSLDDLLITPKPSFFKRHKAEIIGGIVTAVILAAIIVPLAVVFWPVIAALVPVAAGVAIGSALGISAATAATALAATVFGAISAAVVAGLSFCVGKFGLGKKKVPSLPLLDRSGTDDDSMDDSMQSSGSDDADLLSSTIEAKKRDVLYRSQLGGSTTVITEAIESTPENAPAKKDQQIELDEESSSREVPGGTPAPTAASTPESVPTSTGGDSPRPLA